MVDHRLVYDRLTAIACARKVISYYALANEYGLDYHSTEHREALSHILSEISLRENAEGRPLLSAVAVYPEIGYPGREFFLLARELGFNNFDDDRSYYYHELKRVHNFWQMNIPATQTFPYMIIGDHEVRIGHINEG